MMQNEREKLVSELIKWFDYQAHTQLDAPTADLDWRSSAESLADYILQREQKARKQGELEGTLRIVDRVRKEHGIELLELAALTPKSTTCTRCSKEYDTFHTCGKSTNLSTDVGKPDQVTEYWPMQSSVGRYFRDAARDALDLIDRSGPTITNKGKDNERR